MKENDWLEERYEQSHQYHQNSKSSKMKPERMVVKDSIKKM